MDLRDGLQRQHSSTLNVAPQEAQVAIYRFKYASNATRVQQLPYASGYPKVGGNPQQLSCARMHACGDLATRPDQSRSSVPPA